MIFVITVAAAALLGAGWVLQQRVALRFGATEVFSWRSILDLARTPLWWGGIAAMAAGQSLSAWALQLGAVSTVEPVLVTSLVFTFVFAAIACRQKIRWPELVGPLILFAALAFFLDAADPTVNRHADPAWPPIAIATSAAAAATAALWLAGHRIGRRTDTDVDSTIYGAAAGVMYGLQDAATRGVVVATERHNVVVMFSTMWPWVLLGSATIGVLLSQSAFRTGRLDLALPPTVVTQPVTGVVIGICLLGDRLSATGSDLAVESGCLLAIVVAVVLIARSPALTP